MKLLLRSVHDMLWSFLAAIAFVAAVNHRWAFTDPALTYYDMRLLLRYVVLNDGLFLLVWFGCCVAASLLLRDISWRVIIRWSVKQETNIHLPNRELLK